MADVQLVQDGKLRLLVRARACGKTIIEYLLDEAEACGWDFDALVERVGESRSLIRYHLFANGYTVRRINRIELDKRRLPQSVLALMEVGDGDE